MKSLSKILLLLVIANPAYAGLADKLSDTFDKIGISSNITPANIYRGQEGSFAFGGGAHVRTKNMNMQPMWLQPPGWRIGDCSMDLWTGGFGFLNKDKFIQMAKAIGGNASAYAFSLALKQVTPQIANQIESLQAMANTINQANIDSCEAAKYFVNSGIDIIRQSANQSCQTKGIMSGSNEAGTAIGARDQCNKPGESKNLAEEASNDPQLKNQTIINKNIAWSAIQNNPTLKALDLETKHFLMSLTGTIVISQPEGYPEGANAQTETFYASKLDSNAPELLASLASNKDSRVKLYTCVDLDKCLQIKESEVVITASKSIYGQVSKMLTSIENKVLYDQELTVGEKDFIAKTDFEIYKLIKLQTAFTRKVPLSFVGEYSDMIALDLIYKYLDQCVGDVMDAFNNNHLPEKYSDKYMGMMRSARQQLNGIRNLSSDRQAQRAGLRLYAQSMQDQLTANISSQLFSKMSWNKSLRK
jgi:conjugative transfer pilus assembly protein TraH